MPHRGGVDWLRRATLAIEAENEQLRRRLAEQQQQRIEFQEHLCAVWLRAAMHLHAARTNTSPSIAGDPRADLGPPQALRDVATASAEHYQQTHVDIDDGTSPSADSATHEGT